MTIPFRLKIILVLLLAVLFSLPVCKWTAVPRDKWNVLWIVIDDLNVNHLGCYGYKRGVTANIDRLAGRGVRFEYCITQAPWTLPSFASMLSSRHPYEVVMTREYLRHIKAETGVARSRDPYRMPDFNHHWYCAARPEVKLLAEMLKDEGFETFTWTNNQWLSPGISGLERGFDVYKYTDRTDKYYLPAQEILAGTGDWIMDKKDSRWFALIHLMEPHIPYHDHEGIDFGEREIDRYDAEIKYMDDELGGFLDRLEGLGLLDRTVIVINADHGEAVSPDGSRTIGHGGLVTMDVLRVPLIIRWPGCPGGSLISEPIRNLDITPTLLEILGIEPEPGLRGKSLVEIMDGKGETFSRPAFTMAVIKGPEHISLILDGCKAVWIPAYGRESFIDIGRRDKACENVKQVKFELRSLLGEIEALLSAAEVRPPVKISPDERKRLEALGYFR